MNRVGRALRVAVGVTAVGALGAGCALFAESFEPQGGKAVAAREAAARAVEQWLDAIVGDTREHGRLRADACHEGQDNWKRTDPNAWECRVGVAAVVDGAAARSEVVPALEALHGRLVAAGCQPRLGRGLLDVARDYWTPLSSRAGYGPEDLPFQYYMCPDDSQVEVLSSAPGAPTLARDVADPFGSGFAGEIRISSEPLAADALASATSSSAAQLFVLRVTRAYYTIEN
ncbi:MAG TPA: hypothetical protein VFT81_06400 [Dermatophilaceae bacterium]|nr:hypothetical protein [Dermatophilaceae bacterium]